MTRPASRPRHAVTCLFLLMTSVVLVAMPAAASGATTIQPLPESDYSVHPECGVPQPGKASCLAEELVPETPAAEARTHPLVAPVSAAAPAGTPTAGFYGLRPEDLHAAYSLPTTAPDTQTIAIVDAYDDPTAESDLQVYDETFGLPACTTVNGCFRKVNEQGQPGPLPEASKGWAGEIGLDLQAAHAICQNCKILLVEASSSYMSDLGASVDTAVALGADEVSNSYGSTTAEPQADYIHPGVVITAATGDWGYRNWDEPKEGPDPEFPAVSPYVVAVGGTSLHLFGGAYAEEEAWYRAGSGCSTLPAQSWQTSLSDWAQVGCGAGRSTADIAAVAAPITGMAVYNTFSSSGWQTVGGTSLASPIIAATYALAGGSGGVDYPARTLYADADASDLHDVASGYNSGCSHFICLTADEAASCGGLAACKAGTGYDGPTGLGTPDGLGAFEADPSATPPIGPAVIEEPPTHTISVATGGSGPGRIYVSVGPSTEECSTSCSWAVKEGTSVYITAAQGAGSTFVGWSGGGCSGTTQCEVKLSADTSVEAIFESTVPGGGGGTKTANHPGHDIRFHFTSDHRGYKKCTAKASAAYRKARSTAAHAHGAVRPRTLKHAAKRKRRRVAVCRAEYLL